MKADDSFRTFVGTRWFSRDIDGAVSSASGSDRVGVPSFALLYLLVCSDCKRFAFRGALYYRGAVGASRVTHPRLLATQATPLFVSVMSSHH